MLNNTHTLIHQRKSTRRFSQGDERHEIIGVVTVYPWDGKARGVEGDFPEES